MAHNNRIRPALGWVLLSVWDPAEAEQADQYTFEAVNGDQGGTWAPAETIQIGGAGITLDTWLHGAWTATGNVHFSGVPHFVNGATFTNPPTFEFGLNVSAGGNLVLGAGAVVAGPTAIAMFSNVTVADSTGYRFAVAQTFNSWVPLAPTYMDTEWVKLADGNIGYGSVGASKTFLLPATIPQGATITEVKLSWQPGGGHGALPVGADKGGVSLLRRVYPASAVAVVATQVDPSADVPTYETLHDVDITGLAEVVAAGSYYWIRVTGETGANAVSGCSVYWARVRWTHTQMCQPR